MSEIEIPRILFAAPASGSGKTTITCGVLKALINRNMKVASFKCGPDYIDTMFHSSVVGTKARNLDTFFTDENTTRYLLGKAAEGMDIAVMEGVMGYYDGLAGKSWEASTYDVARVTNTPVILIVNGKGCSVSIVALLKGLMEYKKDSHIVGVILNQISETYYQEMKQLIEGELSIGVFGYVPVLHDFKIDSRHLGLKTPHEITDLEGKIEKLAQMMENTLEIDEIIKAARQTEKITYQKFPLSKYRSSGTEDRIKVRIAVARDAAFNFYYEENIELLEEMGATIQYFSPINDKALPKNVSGLILGGGYPENYAKSLAKNCSMKESILQAIQEGIPCLAECGGFMYLQQELEDMTNTYHKMVGAISGKAYKTEKLKRFGYMDLHANTDSILGDSRTTMKGHEFHYWDCENPGNGFTAKKPLRDISYDCIVVEKNLVAGFPHFYYYSNPKAVDEYLYSCRKYEARKTAQKRWDSIAKPIGSLGKLEENLIKIAGIVGDADAIHIEKCALVIMCADHGVVAEGVTQADKSITKIVSENFSQGHSCVNYMAAVGKADVYTIDIGMDTKEYATKEVVLQAVIHRKIARGSGNILRQAAMTKEQCLRALEVGEDIVKNLKEQGYGMIATGEMGIGNTTPTSALAAGLFGESPEKVTGKGAGLSEKGIRHKIEIVKQSVKRVEMQYGCNCSEIDPIEILAQLGGYDIAGMVGIFLGGVKYHMPIIIDGAISAMSAVVAGRIDSRVSEFAIASHESAEITGNLALKELGLKPMITCDMCLGEGTGAVAVLPLLDMGLQVYNNMSTFIDNKIKPYEKYEKE